MNYSVGVRTTPISASSASFPGAQIEIFSQAAQKARLIELGVSAVYALNNVVPTVLLGRSAAVGALRTVVVPFVSDEDGDAAPAQAEAALAWGTAPTLPSNFIRRLTFATNTVGAGVMWIFPRGAGIPAGGSLTLFAYSTNGPVPPLDLWALVDE